MTGFVLHLESAEKYERVDGVESFVGEDRSGGFGILPGHARLVTVLEYGLARFRTANGSWTYLAIPAGTLYFEYDALHLSTRRYFRDNDYNRISRALVDRLLAEEEALRSTRESLERLEQEMFRRLRDLTRRGA